MRRNCWIPRGASCLLHWLKQRFVPTWRTVQLFVVRRILIPGVKRILACSHLLYAYGWSRKTRLVVLRPCVQSGGPTQSLSALEIFILASSPTCWYLILPVLCANLKLRRYI